VSPARCGWYACSHWASCVGECGSVAGCSLQLWRPLQGLRWSVFPLPGDSDERRRYRGARPARVAGRRGGGQAGDAAGHHAGAAGRGARPRRGAAPRPLLGRRAGGELCSVPRRVRQGAACATTAMRPQIPRAVHRPVAGQEHEVPAVLPRRCAALHVLRPGCQHWRRRHGAAQEMAALGPSVAGVSSRLAGPEEGRVFLAFDLAAAAKLKRGRVDRVPPLGVGVIDQWVTSVCTDAARVDPRGCSVSFSCARRTNLCPCSRRHGHSVHRTRSVRNYVRGLVRAIGAHMFARSRAGSSRHVLVDTVASCAYSMLRILIAVLRGDLRIKTAHE
jgi:hypothetical protein